MSVHELDAIERAGEALSNAVDKLDRIHLLALADRLGISSSASKAQVKRKLVDAGYGAK